MAIAKSRNNSVHSKLPLSEAELLEKMTPHSAHVDFVSDISDSDWDSWFDGLGVSDDFMVSREQFRMNSRKTNGREMGMLKGSIEQYRDPTEPVGEENWEVLPGLSDKEYFVPRSRLRREWRRWIRKIEAGADVYSTRCGKNPTLVLLLNDRDDKRFVEKLEQPPRS